MYYSNAEDINITVTFLEFSMIDKIYNIMYFMQIFHSPFEVLPIPLRLDDLLPAVKYRKKENFI